MLTIPRSDPLVARRCIADRHAQPQDTAGLHLHIFTSSQQQKEIPRHFALSRYGRKFPGTGVICYQTINILNGQRISPQKLVWTEWTPAITPRQQSNTNRDAPGNSRSHQFAAVSQLPGRRES